MQSHVLAVVGMSVCPSVCLSFYHTAGLVLKRRQIRSSNLHRRIAQRLWSWQCKAHLITWKGSPQARALNESGVEIIRNFWPISRRISCKIGPRLLLTINRKSHTRFQLVPTSTTLDDPEQPLRTVSKICVFRSLTWQESRAVARKQRDAAAVLFGLKFADNIHCKFKSSQASKDRLQSSKHTGENRI